MICVWEWESKPQRKLNSHGSEIWDFLLTLSNPKQIRSGEGWDVREEIITEWDMLGKIRKFE